MSTKGDTGEFVCGRHGDKLEGLVSIRRSAQFLNELSESGKLAMEQNGMRTDHEQLAQISVAHLGDAFQPLLSA
ncbi:hypothetical protein MPL3356_340186 [Mesorhizobium plurifarium]|uniref:Uncharacterized protein n=1 Tax=Mesorhizobium plurifarium TaxID=69974 RepID=A0A090DVT4_MESPL|nr:hypothetical protein MPL3356_340186 [Mesorhizobium plurifarium]